MSRMIRWPSLKKHKARAEILPPSLQRGHVSAGVLRLRRQWLMLVFIDRVPLEPQAAEKVPLISLAVNSKVLRLQCNLQMGRISFRD